MTKVLAAAISFFLLSFLLSYAFLGHDRNRDALQRIKHIVINFDKIGVLFLDKDCVADTCYQEFKNRSDLEFIPAGGEFLDLSREKRPEVPGPTRLLFRFNTDLTPAMLQDSSIAVFSFPRVQYDRADLYWQGTFRRTLFRGDHIDMSIESKDLTAGNYTFDLVLEIDPDDLSNVIRWSDPFFVASHRDYSWYLNQLNVIELGQGEQIGMIARIVLAALMLLFFVMLDGSESALGVSLAMGFEAAGMCLGNVSLEHQWISSSSFWTVTKLTFYTIADFASLYFLLCISGHKRFKVWTWIGAGLVIGLAYGVIMTFWRDEVPMIRSFWIPRILGTVGVGLVICCFAAVRTIRTRDFWKSVAILFAIVGMGVTVVEAFGSLFPGFEDNETITAVLAVFKSIRAYVLTLSSLASIASMREELALAEQERVKARKMAHELSLGREMQEALLEVPAPPEGVEVSVSHIPAAYVSGDTYFFDWNPLTKVFTLLLNDVPGHGLQAALKAFACNVIAKTIWSQGKVAVDRRKYRSKFPTYKNNVVEMFSHQNDSMPFNAFTGIEIFFDQKIASVYRSNYNEPVVIIPGENGTQVSVLTCRSGEHLEVPLTPGVCFVLVSDGLVSTSKEQKKFVDQLSRAIEQRNAGGMKEFVSKDILDVVLDPAKVAVNQTDDDRTIIVVRWTGEYVAVSPVAV